VRTEGGLIVNRGIGYPQLRMKSPYRYQHISDVITDILNHAGITKSDIAVPERDVAAHFSSNGRVNYDLIGTSDLGSGNPVTWNGYVTDFLHDGDKWYFLYNKGRGNPNGFSQVIVYDISTRTYTKLHGFSSATEAWRFTKSGNNLYIVATTGGNYDANESSCETRIIQLDIATQTETVFVAHTGQLQPQLSHYYHGVGSAFHKPDSRRPLIYRENDGLYFAYVDRSNSQFGIAKSTAPGATPRPETLGRRRGCIRHRNGDQNRSPPIGAALSASRVLGPLLHAELATNRRYSPAPSSFNVTAASTLDPFALYTAFPMLGLLRVLRPTPPASTGDKSSPLRTIRHRTSRDQRSGSHVHSRTL